MKEDLLRPKVEDVAFAIVKEPNSENEMRWRVYFINMRDHLIESVIVRSSGYGKDGEEEIKTSEFRHFLEDVPAMSFVKVETLVEEVFHLSNQYWVSFFYGGMMYDKKYVFMPDSVSEKNLSKIPLVGKMGVMIR